MAIEVERRGAIAVVTMSRPEALNAFNNEQLVSLAETFDLLAADGSVRAVVLTGAGDRAFAAGADIKEMKDLDGVGGLAFGRAGHRATRAVEELPQPVIAAVNGFALGGGCELALAADIRLASENAVFAQPEVTLGIPPGWGGSQRLPRLVGPGMAAELILTGRRVKADEALRIGLVNAVYPLDRLMDEAVKMAESIAANSPLAVRSAKQLMRLAFNGQTIDGLDSEARAFGVAFTTNDQKEGMTAFVEKRAATFQDPA
ncbi:MAG: enoyl-CoA hydratase-related protein [Thermomicrobiales bacterium]